jgi:hypothetical protein
MIHSHRLEGENTKRFTLAGNATLTIVSMATGTRFTYRVRSAPKQDETTPEAQRTWFVKLLCGSDNNSDYRYIGFIRGGKFIHGAGKSYAGADAPSVIAFGWFVRTAVFGQVANEKLEVWHEGHCGRCGRRLTVPESIETGMGPECASRMGSRSLRLAIIEAQEDQREAYKDALAETG